jgi:polyhydroxyalkanoate synthesis regulator phasin
MADPTDMIIPLLREMRAEVTEGFSSVNLRLEKIENKQVSFRQVQSADSLMSKLLTGEFEERIQELKKRVRDLESQK